MANERAPVAAGHTGGFLNSFLRRAEQRAFGTRALAVVSYREVKRRSGWFLDNLTVRKAANMMQAMAYHLGKQDRVHSWPIALKIDISPLCNLHCVICLHAHPNGNPLLEKQRFHGRQKMTVAQFRRIVSEVRGKACVASLYYFGDPMVHPDLDEMCEAAAEAEINTHVSTHFSFRLSDERIKRLLTSGMTHLTVCLDGFSQEVYEKNRVGGRVDWVLNNLRRLCRLRRILAHVYPKVEVQYLEFDYNLHEVEKAAQWCEEIGVDSFSRVRGGVRSYSLLDPASFRIIGPAAAKWLPRCYWPHLFMLIKYDGNVIPCCKYRIASQYTEVDDPHTIGNVFDTGVRDVWCSPRYEQLRRMVCNPEAVGSEPPMESAFCYGCPQLFEVECLPVSRKPGQQERTVPRPTLTWQVSSPLNLPDHTDNSHRQPRRDRPTADTP